MVVKLRPTVFVDRDGTVIRELSQFHAVHCQLIPLLQRRELNLKDRTIALILISRATIAGSHLPS